MRINPARMTLAIALWSEACLPIPTTSLTSPRIAGTVRSADGTGLALESYAVAIDSSCSTLLATTLTDSLGRLAFAPTREHSEFVLMLPIDGAAHAYHVCSLTPDGWVPVGEGRAVHGKQVDSIECTRANADRHTPPLCHLDSRI